MSRGVRRRRWKEIEKDERTKERKESHSQHIPYQRHSELPVPFPEYIEVKLA
jgi:hypothetical protein